MGDTDIVKKEKMEECFRELKKDKAPGIDGVTIGEYEENLESSWR